MIQRKVPETPAPMMAPMFLSCGSSALTVAAAYAMPIAKREYYRRMAQREEEPDAQGPFPFLQHVPHGVVHRGNVVRIKGMTQAEHVGDESQPDELRIAARVMQIRSPAKNVQRADEAIEQDQTGPFGAREQDLRGEPGDGPCNEFKVRHVVPLSSIMSELVYEASGPLDAFKRKYCLHLSTPQASYSSPCAHSPGQDA